ncbi:hypothetical protein [Nocardioides sp.]|uniref:hypothetical protein n=1 Tax=Nocardioides sp. TaxID=35761 RepID=UPI00261E3F56|nr:hypothetical protein [Nocardioides sp.]MDI6910133.1 hypothetical protein [Nocardioides sp.]
MLRAVPVRVLVGVLRLPGASTGADQDVATARERGIPVWHRVEDVPGYRHDDVEAVGAPA